MEGIKNNKNEEWNLAKEKEKTTAGCTWWQLIDVTSFLNGIKKEKKNIFTEIINLECDGSYHTSSAKDHRNCVRKI